MSHEIGTAANYLDLLDRLDTFLTANGHAWGVSYAGTGNGRITGYRGSATSVAETWTITATSATVFTVSGSVSGAQPNATVGTAYSAPRIQFTLVAGSAAFAAVDVFTLNTSPPWTRLRWAGSIGDVSRWGTGAWDSANPASRAFDNLATTSGHQAHATALPSQLGVTMHKPSEVRQVRLTCGPAPAQGPRDFALQRSADGTTWTDVQAWTAQTWTMGFHTRVYDLAAAPGAHLHWRINFTAGNTMPMQVGELELRVNDSVAWSLEGAFEFAWAAPGSGGGPVHVGGTLWRDPAADIQNWRLSCWRFHDANLSTLAQVGGAPWASLSLHNSPTPYWFVANARRVVVVARVSTVYQMAYLGLGLPYETPSVHAFPAVCAGTSEADIRWSDTSVAHRLAFMPGDGMHAQYPDNVWRRVRNRAAGSGDDGSPDGSNGKVWPAARDLNGDVQSAWRDRLDGGQMLLPCVIVHAHGGVHHVWGELDGLYWTSGFGNSAESLIRGREGGYDYDHLSINNVFRTAVQHWGAVRLD
jgi:hypothetical protein